MSARVLVPVLFALFLGACGKKPQAAVRTSSMALGVNRRIDTGLLARTVAGHHPRALAILRTTADVPAVVKQVHSFAARFPVRQVGKAPVLAFAADAKTLTFLSTLSEVVRIVPDKVGKTSSAWSTIMMHADKIWRDHVEGNGFSVAVLDTGIDDTHPYLRDRIVQQACFSMQDSYGRETLCPDGTMAETGGRAAVPTPIAEAAHGTHVAGIAAGLAGNVDGCRIDGLARSAKIVAIQVFSTSTDSDDCGGSPPCYRTFQSSQVDALQYVSDQQDSLRVAAANMSFEDADAFGRSDGPCDDGTRDPRVSLIEELFAHGVATVIAAGNEMTTGSVSAPACITAAITAGATQCDDLPAAFADGSMVDFVAPGWHVLSSVAGGGYEAWDGTSMAAPYVSGAIAALRSAQGFPSLNQILSALRAAAVTVYDPRSGDAKLRLDLASAEKVLAVDGGASPPTSPAHGLGVTPAAVTAVSASPSNSRSSSSGTPPPHSPLDGAADSDRCACVP